MDQEKVAKLIKKIRKDNNLTQKQLADKYNLTYQAVSKWERGINLPDTALLKQISKDFNISVDDILNGEISDKKKNNNLYLILITIIILVVIVGIVIINVVSKNNESFKFKTLSTTCENFNISGNISYNDSKSSIFISNIEYCGGEDNTLYEEIECILYESHEEIDIKISSYSYNDEENITLEEFLKSVTIAVDDYHKSCEEYTDTCLYLSVNATDANNKITTYKIPLSLEQICIK